MRLDRWTRPHTMNPTSSLGRVHMELSTVISAARRLVSVETAAEQGGSLSERLKTNLDSFHSLLREPEYGELVQKLELTRKEGEVETTEWRFAMEGLRLLQVLDDTLSEEDKGTQRVVESKTPPAPKNLMSVADQKVVMSLVQFIVSLGIYPYLLPGVDTLLKLRLPHAADSIAKAEALPNDVKAWYLCKSSHVLTKCFKNSLLGPILMSQHLSDVLAALIQIGFGPLVQHTGKSIGRRPILTPADVHTTSEQGMDEKNTIPKGRVITAGDRGDCLEALHSLLNKVYQPLVVRELLMLQGMPSASELPSQMRQKASDSGGKAMGVRVRSPRWLQKACGQLLSERLLQKNGVQHVLRGIFEATAVGPGGMGGGAGDWRKCQAVARIISSCPAQATSVEEYYSLVCPQVLTLLHLPMEGIGRQFLRVAVATISVMFSQQPLLSINYLLNPLIRPLKLLAGDLPVDQEALESFSDGISVCLEDLNKICGAVEPSSPLLKALLPYLPVVFEVWRSCNSGDSHIGSQAQDVLLGILKPSDPATVILFLRAVAHMPSPEHCPLEFRGVCPDLVLSVEEGCRLVLKQDKETDRQNVDMMESIADHVINLLRSDLKSSNVPSLLFVDCLQYIAVVLCQRTGYSAVGTSMEERVHDQEIKRQTSGRSSLVLLECERSIRDAFTDALVLYLTASLCENMSGDVLETVKLSQLIEVISVVVECHARFISEWQKSNQSGMLVARPDLEGLLGGTITLSIAFGLLSAILGGARQVDKSEKPIVSGMLPALETIASQYPDQELCGLANDLRICVATLGAVWSAEMRETAAEVGGALAKKAKSSATKQYKSKKSSASPEEKEASPLLKSVEKLTVDEMHEVSTSIPPEHQQRTDKPTLFQEALQQLKDPLLPVRGHGLISLTKLVEKKDPEALANTETLRTIFKENLMHSDSYIYLAAIGGLVALGSAFPQETISLLCLEYAQFSGQSSRKDHLDFDKETGQLKSQSARTVDKPLSRSAELRMKLGEALVKVARNCGEMLPHYSDTILAAILSSVNDPDPLIRASSLSNLAEVCALLRFSFGSVQNEVLSCLSHLLRTDQEAKVRQAALVVLKLLIKGLSQDAIKVLGDSLLDIYRLLKQVESTERDDLTKAHAQAALGELDTVMRGLLFPRQTLTKKITVLDV